MTRYTVEEPFLLSTTPSDTLRSYSLIVERLTGGGVHQKYRTSIDVNPMVEAEWPLLIVNLATPWAEEYTAEADVFRGDRWGLQASPDRETLLGHEAVLLIDWLGLIVVNNLDVLQEGLRQGQRLCMIGGLSFNLTEEHERLSAVVHARYDSSRQVQGAISRAESAPSWWPEMTFSLSEAQDATALVPAHGAQPLLVDEQGTVVAVWWQEPAPGAFLALFNLPDVETDQTVAHERQIIEALIRLLRRQ